MKRVAILGNGSSILDVDLNKIDCDTIGLNRSWELFPQPTHHLMSDSNQWGMYQHIAKRDPKEFRGLVTPPKGPGQMTVNMVKSEKPKWSMHPRDFGVYLGGTVLYAALQLAVHLWDYTELYIVGLDLYPKKAKHTDEPGSGKFWGGPWHASTEAKHRESLGFAAAVLERELGITVWNLNPKSKCQAFDIKPFDEVFR